MFNERVETHLVPSTAPTKKERILVGRAAGAPRLVNPAGSGLRSSLALRIRILDSLERHTESAAPAIGRLRTPSQFMHARPNNRFTRYNRKASPSQLILCHFFLYSQPDRRSHTILDRSPFLFENELSRLVDPRRGRRSQWRSLETATTCRLSWLSA